METDEVIGSLIDRNVVEPSRTSRIRTRNGAVLGTFFLVLVELAAG